MNTEIATPTLVEQILSGLESNLFGADHLAAIELANSAPNLLRQRDEVVVCLREVQLELVKLTQSYVVAKQELNQFHGFIENVTEFPIVVNAKDAISQARAVLTRVEGSVI